MQIRFNPSASLLIAIIHDQRTAPGLHLLMTMTPWLVVYLLRCHQVFGPISYYCIEQGIGQVTRQRKKTDELAVIGYTNSDHHGAVAADEIAILRQKLVFASAGGAMALQDADSTGRP